MSAAEVEVQVGGRQIRLETGRIARQAHGSVLVRQADTVLLATAVAADEPRPGVSFFPLTVEYRERMAAGGRIPGSYGRREGRISDHEVLVSRLADRSVRPLFPDGFRNETQIFLTVMSADAEVEPNGLAILAAAAALEVSDVPWHGPIAGVRIARLHGEWQLFPTRRQRAAAELDLVVGSGPAGMVMVEGQGREVPESVLVEALGRADAACRELAGALTRLRERGGRDKRPFDPPRPDPEVAAAVTARAAGPVAAALAITGKTERRAALARARAEALDELLRERPEDEEEMDGAFEALVKQRLRRRILDERARPDGRGPEDVRAIWSDAGWLPRAHGSAVFTRGETQALVSCTLGTGSDELRYDTLEGTERERFLLHYNFPPYSVGEVRPMRGPGRREIGHGNLAHRALEPVLPSLEDFPYTMRLVSDISESNGSSSMATVCGGCLALMDAGVPLTAPVAGIAMGLVAEDGRHQVLSDILGDEDHLGDMDFKVAGTADGVTAIQMDNKLGALPPEVLSAALEQARQGRLHILAEMAQTLAEPRPELSRRAPRVTSLRIRPERIRDLIGPGGRRIQEVQSSTGTSLDVGEDGLVRIYAQEAASAAAAVQQVRHLTLEPEVGRVYRGEVVLVRDFFAVLRLGASVEGRLHVSEADTRRVGRLGDLMDRGDKVLVRVLGVDDQGRIVLSRRAALGADESEVAG
jgi:polyribonucleotide nucleotidyltransferase